jgi:hypothetical protein
MASSKVKYVRCASEESISLLRNEPSSSATASMTNELADNESAKPNTEFREDVEASRTRSSKDDDEDMPGMERVELTEEDVYIPLPDLRA